MRNHRIIVGQRVYALHWTYHMEWTGEPTMMGGEVIQSDVRDDHFIHFTTPERAAQIMKDGWLLINPPHEKFGTDTVNAVSTLYGEYVPAVQTLHLEDDVVTVMFSTDTRPEYGHVEEVVWKKDVKLRNPMLVQMNEAIFLINKSPAELGEQDMVVYE